MRWLQWLLGDRLPEGFTGNLDDDEHVLATATTGGGPVVVTSAGVWVPGGDRHRRIDWHLVSKATWSEGALSIVEAEETEVSGGAALIADRRPVRFRLEQPGKVPKVVHQRVNASITSRYYKELPGGGAWFVQRKVPGGVMLQVRPDPGTDSAVVSAIAAEAAESLREAGRD